MSRGDHTATYHPIVTPVVDVEVFEVIILIVEEPEREVSANLVYKLI